MAYQTRTAYGLSSELDGAWRELALCANFDPEIWFPIGQSNTHDIQEEHALEVCRRCPVRAECTGWAVDNAVLHGVWGVPESELKAMVRERHGFHVFAPGRHELCAQGHEMTDDNVYVDRRGKRSCRMCRRLRRDAHRRNLRTVMAS